VAVYKCRPLTFSPLWLVDDDCLRFNVFLL